MYLTDLYAKGGVITIILSILSVYVIAVILYKILQFFLLGSFKHKAIKKLLEQLEYEPIQNLTTIVNNQKNMLASLVQSLFPILHKQSLTRAQKEEALSASGSRFIYPFESHLKGLEMVAAIAPLLGLLGTVIGMVEAFSALENAGSQVNPSMLAGGIWAALLTTIAGLVVAIPALAAHYVVNAHVTSIQHTVEHALSTLLTKNPSL